MKKQIYIIGYLMALSLVLSIVINNSDYRIVNSLTFGIIGSDFIAYLNEYVLK